MNAILKMPRKEVLIDPIILFNRIKSLEEKLDVFTQSHSSIKIKSKNGIDIVPTFDILFCQADGNYTMIVLRCDKTIYASKTLKHFVEQLPSSFIRTHQSFLVNKQFVRGINFSPNELVMIDGTHIPISRSKKQIIENHF